MKDRHALRIAGYVIAALLSAFFQYFEFSSGEVFLGMPWYKANEIVTDIYVSYFACLGLASIYHMYRRQGDSFESYCLKTFFGLVRTSVVYGLFAAGLAIIVLIFDTLIFHTHNFIGRVEIFLAGGIYVPAMLLVVSGKKGGVGKFAKACVLYVLEPMLILAMAIIYIYIVKIFVTNDIPSNAVFSIITSLFAAGMVIWTLACGIDEANVFCKIARILPFVFIPCILLQAWSVLIRIGDYGITPSRYFGVALVIFELIYMVLYLLQRLLKKEAIALILWVAALAVVTALLVPFANYTSVCARSQLKRLSGIKISEALKRSDLAETAGSSYRVLLNDCGYRGKELIDQMFTKDEQKILNSCYGTSDSGRRIYYLNGNDELVEFDISGYKTLTSVDGKGTEPISTVELTVDGEVRYTTDLSEFVKVLEEFGSKKTDSSQYEPFNLSEYGPISLDEHYDLKITWFSADYNADTRELEDLNLNGYLLEK
ncbi:MAG: DUF4153 domain-containing protein [Lachnospiraceae bacterium]|nr:DUF4153 domain-containing protein [Lachnospiraceae bacterium]